MPDASNHAKRQRRALYQHGAQPLVRPASGAEGWRPAL